MSSVTLETLRADHASILARHLALCEMPNFNGDIKKEMEYGDRMIDFVVQGRKALELCEIAEHFGLSAAMLFKLSDGAIDPRVKA